MREGVMREQVESDATNRPRWTPMTQTPKQLTQKVETSIGQTIPIHQWPLIGKLVERFEAIVERVELDCRLVG